MQGAGSLPAVRIDDVDPDDAGLFWLRSAEPGISVERVGDGVLLRSASLSTGEIADAWLCASLNERLLTSARDRRRATLADLLS